MKKISLRSKILLGAVLLGGTFAGAHAFVNLPGAQETRYDWTGAPNAPNNPGGTLDNQTEAQASTHFGCEGETEVCAIGVATDGVGDDVTIRFN
ncbi:MAG: hypothetical protein ACTILG_12685 [Sphingobacterium sp.]